MFALSASHWFIERFRKLSIFWIFSSSSLSPSEGELTYFKNVKFLHMSSDSVRKEGKPNILRCCNLLQFTRFKTSKFGRSSRCTVSKRIDALKFNSFNPSKRVKGLHLIARFKRKIDVALPETFKYSSEQFVPVCSFVSELL